MGLEVQVKTDREWFTVDLEEHYDLSLRIQAAGVKAWYVSDPNIRPVRGDGFVGSVAEGGSVNFFDIDFNPHGHGTHTECIGHISQEKESLEELDQYHFTAVLVSLKPSKVGPKDFELAEDGDVWISAKQLQQALGGAKPQAVIIRTLPNSTQKKDINYSGTNPCYFEPAALAWLEEIGVNHILVDLPSVDREHDQGKLLAHRAFWKTSRNENNAFRTITELIYVPDAAKDGWYWLNLMISAFDNDAQPSRPVIYPIKTRKKHG